MHRIVPVAACLALLVSIVGAAPAAAGGPIGAAVIVEADVEGVAIRPSQVPDVYCHDRDFPRIHCYRTADRLEAALAPSGGAGYAATASGDYVVIYSSTSYAGGYMYISQNYDALFVVGWNDRIRSYRSINGGLGRFWTDWYAGGYNLDFCCNTIVPSLSATFDRQISSVYRR